MKKTPNKRTRGAEGIRQRGPKTFDIKLPLGRDPVTGKKKDKWQVFKGTLREAKVERGRLLGELKGGTYIEPTKLTVETYLESWLTDHAKYNVSAKTFERYDEIIRKHLIPALGKWRLAKLAPLHIHTYYAAALENGRLHGKGGLSAQTVKHHHRVLSQALKKAVRLQLLNRNPCDAVDPPRPIRREMRVLDHAETATLLKAAEGRAIHIPVLLAVTTGMRRGEILGLRWRDVDLDGHSLSVVQTLEQTKDSLSFKAPKTARSRRTITLPRLTVEALKPHRTQQKKDRLRLGTVFEDHDLVCPLVDGSPRKPRELTKQFHRLVNGLGLKVRFHDLRHTHISHLLAAGVHPKVASERAGHASIAITLDVYSHVMPGMQEDAAMQIDAALRTHLEQ